MYNDSHRDKIVKNDNQINEIYSLKFGQIMWQVLDTRDVMTEVYLYQMIIGVSFADKYRKFSLPKSDKI